MRTKIITIILYIVAMILLLLTSCIVISLINDSGIGVVTSKGLLVYPLLVTCGLTLILEIMMLLVSYLCKQERFVKLTYFFLLFISILSLSGNLYFLKNYRFPYDKETCQMTLRNLAGIMIEYQHGNNTSPVPDKWCDVLYEYKKKKSPDHNFEHYFICPGVRKGRCTFALNSKVKKDSPDDVVWLFDSYVGWNLNGGKELLNPDNHDGKGCNVLFCGGKIDFVETEKFDELKWE